ncbi:restin homolog [Bufo gargarizans]|uniref:restin homolog n=1 Tax=Bufo gargarizans TaxID=30331 RepID=UPI001CF197A1|nr:restin homolog [Bufo gargarizans]
MRGEKINLPHVEKALEKTPKPAKTFLDKSKYSKDFGCSTSNLLNVPTFSHDGQKESRLEKQTWLEIPVPKTSDRLSPEIAKLPEYQSCKNEKKIRSDYDKVHMQTKREKEALQLKVSELEAELRRQEVYKKSNEEHECTSASLDGPYQGCLFMESCENNYKNKFTINCEDYRKLEKSNREKQEKIGCLLAEIEELNTKLNTIQYAERDQAQLFKSKQSKLVSDIEDLRSQLEKAKEREKLKVSCLEGEKAEILTKLENTKADLEKLKKRRSPVGELHKDFWLLEIEKLKAYAEKMKEENLSLSDTIRVLQQDLEKRSISSCFSPQMYTGGAEVLLISHGNAPEYTHTGATDYKSQEICSCGRTLQNLTSASNKSSSAVEDVTVKEVYRQMKRERNLLLDVMVIMYERRWFVEEALPHVRRALRKCGALSLGAD